MSRPDDFIVVNVPDMLAVKATISYGFGLERPDPDWNREAAENQFLFAEFLAEKGLVVEGVKVERRPDLVVWWSELTEQGQRFARSDFHKWLISIDKPGTTETKKREKLERRWKKFDRLANP